MIHRPRCGAAVTREDWVALRHRAAIIDCARTSVLVAQVVVAERVLSATTTSKFASMALGTEVEQADLTATPLLRDAQR